jgi:O-antigen/teichoic acid export membrane protein
MLQTVPYSNLVNYFNKISISFGAFEAVHKLANWATIVILGYLLSDSVYADFGLYVGAQTTLILILSAFVNHYIFKFKEPDLGYIDSLFSLIFFVSIVFLGVSIFFGNKWITLFLFSITNASLFSISKTALTSLRKENNLKLFARIKLLQFVSYLIILLAAYFFIENKIYAYIWAFLGSNIWCLLYLNLDISFAALGKVQVLLFALPYAANSVLKSIISYFDRFWIFNKLSVAEAAEYTLAFSIVSVVNFVNYFYMINYERELYGNDRGNAAKKYLFRNNLVLVLLLFLIFIVMYVDVIGVGKSDYTYLILLFISNTLIVNYSLLLVYLNINNYRNRIPIISLLGAVITISLCLYLIPKWGVMGAIFSTFTANFVPLVFFSWRTGGLHKLDLFIKAALFLCLFFRYL